MVLKGIFNRLGRKDEEQLPAAGDNNDGWVELVNGRLVVHDPGEDGRYATLTPEAGIRLWINDEEISEPTAVTAQDRIRFEVAPDPLGFFELRVSDDSMSVEMAVTADPVRLPDTVAVAGRHQARLQPGYSSRAKHRPVPARQIILDRLRSLGVEFGIDEAAIDRGLSEATGNPVVIARGQQAEAPTPGQWVWRLDEWSMVEAGQVIASHQEGTPNRPRITVKGEATRVYEDIPEPQVYLAGNGTRLVPGGRLVASASGRARAVPTPQGSRVHIFPVHRVEGDLEGELQVQADVIILGNVKNARITSTGECYVTGNVEKSEIRAEVITIRGAALESNLFTVPQGHFVVLRAELNWLQQKVEAMREAIHNHKPITEEAFREASAFVRALRRKAEQMGINHPEYTAAMEEVSRVFMGAQALSGIDLPTLARMLMGLVKLHKAAEHTASGARDVRVHALGHTTVWAGRDIHVEEKVGGSYLFSGGAVRTPAKATLSQTELSAAGDVIVGTLASVRGTAPVSIRFGGRVEATEAQAGCALEFGTDRKEFKSDLMKIAAAVNARGQLIVRQRD